MGSGLKRFAVLLVGAAAVGALRTAPVSGQPPVVRPNERAVGYAVHIAGDALDPKAYGGREAADLPGARKDLADMRKLSEGLGYQPVAVLSGKSDKDETRATRANVLKALRAASDKASGANGDIVLITYSGRGALLPDEADDSDEADGLDNAWCLYDGMLVDDEVLAALAQFRTGVRVVLVLDSDYGGTTVKGEQLSARNFADFRAAKAKNPAATAEAIIADTPSLKARFGDRKGRPSGPAARGADPLLCLLTYSENEKLYQRLTSYRNTHPAVVDTRTLAPVVIVLAACRKDQVALDVGSNGLFTRELLSAWNGGKFEGNYRTFNAAVRRRVAAAAAELKSGGGGLLQQPEMSVWGGAPEDKKDVKNWTPSFEGQKPFAIK